jgi:hypothetical protein
MKSDGKETPPLILHSSFLNITLSFVSHTWPSTEAFYLRYLSSVSLCEFPLYLMIYEHVQPLVVSLFRGLSMSFEAGHVNA